MNKVEYSDLYKFAVSLGLVLITLALLIPCILIRDLDKWMISPSTYRHLSASAQYAFRLREIRALWFSHNYGLFAVPLAVLGAVLILLGLPRWLQQQANLDSELGARVKAIAEGTSEKTLEGILQDAATEVRSDAEENVDVVPPAENVTTKEMGAPQESTATEGEEGSLVAKYVLVESTLASKLQSALQGNYGILRNRRLGTHEADIILVSRSPYGTDFLIDVRYAPYGLSLAQLHKTLGQLFALRKQYLGITVKVANMLLFLVTSDRSMRSLQAMYDNISEKYRPLKVRLITEEQLQSLTDEQLMKMLKN
jgi:hypothetical protein